MVKLINKVDIGIPGDETVELRESPAVHKWLGSIGESSVYAHLWQFKAFMKWARVNGGKFAEMTPDDMVEYVLDGSVRDTNEMLDLKKRYLLGMVGGIGHKQNANKAICGFFRHNRAPLPKDTTLRLRPDEGHAKVEGTLTPDEIRRVILASDKMYQAIFLIMVGGGFGRDEFIAWSNTGLDGLQEQLDGDLVRVPLSGRKGMKGQYNYHTYIGGDALAALRRYIKTVRPLRAERALRKGKATDAIFMNQWGKPLTDRALYWYWSRKLKRLGVVEPDRHRRKVPRYGKNLHEIRDVYRTLFRKSGVDVEYGEYFMGHEDAFDKYGYDKTYKEEHDLRTKYKEALPYLCLLSSNKPYDLVDKNEYDNAMITELQAKLKENEEARVQTQAALERLERLVREKLGVQL